MQLQLHARISNGMVVQVADLPYKYNDTWVPLLFPVELGSSYSGGVFTPPPDGFYLNKETETLEPIPVPDLGSKVTKLAFKNRFPRNKWVAAKQAAKSDSGLEDFFEDFDIAKFIDLSYPATIAGVTSLTDASVPAPFRLTQAEADAVLLAPVTEDELP